MEKTTIKDHREEIKKIYDSLMKNSIFLLVLSISISILTIENSPSLASCSLFGYSQSSVAECNLFGCPNPPLGRECTLFGCPGSPQPERPATTPVPEAATTRTYNYS